VLGVLDAELLSLIFGSARSQVALIPFPGATPNPPGALIRFLSVASFTAVARGRRARVTTEPRAARIAGAAGST